MAEKEYIERGAAIDLLHYHVDETCSAVVSDFEAIPAADVVEVVRCKDCKHYGNHPNGLCYAWTEPYDNERGYKGEVHCVEPDDFCSCGERKENEA